MADYASASCALFYGTDVSNPTMERTLTSLPASPVRHLYQRLVAPVGSSVTVDLEEFTVITELYAWNLDAINYLTFNYTCLSTNSAQVEKILPGQWIKLTDVKVTGSITPVANTATCVCEVWIVGQ